MINSQPKFNNIIILAFVGMCLAWGFSWYSMKLQINSPVEAEVSLFYRFTIVSMLMFLVCFFTKTRLKLKKDEWSRLPFIALCNFSLNFFIGYHATKVIASGIIAVIFSLSVITSELIKSYLDNHKMSKKIIVSGIFGTIGLIFFVTPSLIDSQKPIPAVGFVYAFCMMLVFSFGNYLVANNNKQNRTPLFTTISYCSAFGALYFLLYIVIAGYKFSFDYSVTYVGSLIYQIFFASIMAFICLYYLIAQIGAAKANYTALVYPTIALTVSSFFENYKFNVLNIMGLLLIIMALSFDFFYNKFYKSHLR